MEHSRKSQIIAKIFPETLAQWNTGPRNCKMRKLRTELNMRVLLLCLILEMYGVFADRSEEMSRSASAQVADQSETGACFAVVYAADDRADRFPQVT